MRLSLFVKAVLVTLLVTAAVATAYEFVNLNQPQSLVVSTTTSTFDTGLLDYLTPIFESEHSVQLKILSKGTGESLEIARRGDADVVLVHARDLELKFIDEGYGVHRVGVMYNDFIIIGPTNDPARIIGNTNASYAFWRISLAGMKGLTLFISRADKSGTNIKELNLWHSIGLEPSNGSSSWYLEAGAGMGTVLRLANEKKAYTLTDRGTWLAFKDQLGNLKVLVQGDASLLNPYAVIPVNPQRFPQRNYNMAVSFAKFMISIEGQDAIASFKKSGEGLFTPIARNYTLAHELGFPTQEQEVSWYDSTNPIMLFHGTLTTQPFAMTRNGSQT